MRGTSVIAICEVAGMGREITVRNVVWGIRGSPGGLAPPGSAGRLAPPCGRDGARPYRCGSCCNSYGGGASCGHAIRAGLTEHLPGLSGFFSQFFKADVLIEVRLSPFGIIARTAIHQHDEPFGINFAQCLGKSFKARRVSRLSSHVRMCPTPPRPEGSPHPARRDTSPHLGGITSRQRSSGSRCCRRCPRRGRRST